MKISTIIGLLIVVAIILVFAGIGVIGAVRGVTEQLLLPVSNQNNNLATQISQILNPTPTVLPDPITIVREVRAMARMETVQYTVERVITAEIGQGPLGSLFGDRLLLVAHGVIIAGVDMEKLRPTDLEVRDGVLYVKLPPAEIFIATLDNDKSYIYDRDTGIFTKGNVDLETAARQEAVRAIREAAEDDGILTIANRNAENYFSLLFSNLGYPDVIFVIE